MRSVVAEAALLAVLAAVAGCSAGPAPRTCPNATETTPTNDVAETPTTSQVAPARDLDLPVEPPTRHERYWGAIVVADVVGVAVATPAMTKPQPLWLLPYVSLSPLVHVAYGEPAHAAESILLRASLMSLAYGTTRLTRPEECSQGSVSPDLACVEGRGVLPFVVATTIATVVDAKFLAQRDVPLDDWSRLPVVPSIARTVDGRGDAAWSFSLAGAF